MKHKEQLKSLLVLSSYVSSLDEAERLVLAGKVRVNGELLRTPSVMVALDAQITVDSGNKYVSRGGLKLEGALEDFNFDPTGLNCIDAGASSGGFTDCLLQRGAATVVSVDVGYGQFDWKLRKDSRVKLFERTNIAKVSPEELGAPFDLLVADLSFISLARLAEVFVSLVREQGAILTLVKPQFELPKASVKDGVVRSLDLHVKALEKVRSAYEEVGFSLKAMGFSPLLGPKGNIEFWIWAIKGEATATISEEQVVRLAHTKLLESKESTAAHN